LVSLIVIDFLESYVFQLSSEIATFAPNTARIMDQKALEYTREHYDKHSNQYENSKEALKKRAQGPGAPLKRFHNTIKRQLINRFATNAGSLLDFACGRGGDLWKWIDAGISYVKGIDLSPGEIIEAKKRFKESTAKVGPTLKLQADFEDTTALGIEEWKEPRQYDVVTCMFAIHYFFVAEKALRQFLHNVSINLKDGGYFIGTVPEGKAINECIKRGGLYKQPMLHLEAKWKGTPQPFGSPYICAIGDTVTGKEQGTEGSYEYLVYSNVLVGVAAQFGLRPVIQYGDAQLEEMLAREDLDKPLKHFAPYFPGSDPSLEAASRLFATFVFQKIKGEARAPGLGNGTTGGEKLREEKEGREVEAHVDDKRGQRQPEQERQVEEKATVGQKHAREEGRDEGDGDNEGEGQGEEHAHKAPRVEEDRGPPQFKRPVGRRRPPPPAPVPPPDPS